MKLLNNNFKSGKRLLLLGCIVLLTSRAIAMVSDDDDCDDFWNFEPMSYVLNLSQFNSRNPKTIGHSGQKWRIESAMGALTEQQGCQVASFIAPYLFNHFKSDDLLQVISLLAPLSVDERSSLQNSIRRIYDSNEMKKYLKGLGDILIPYSQMSQEKINELSYLLLPPLLKSLAKIPSADREDVVGRSLNHLGLRSKTCFVGGNYNEGQLNELGEEVIQEFYEDFCFVLEEFGALGSTEARDAIEICLGDTKAQERRFSPNESPQGGISNPLERFAIAVAAPPEKYQQISGDILNYLSFMPNSNYWVPPRQLKCLARLFEMYPHAEDRKSFSNELNRLFPQYHDIEDQGAILFHLMTIELSCRLVVLNRVNYLYEKDQKYHREVCPTLKAGVWRSGSKDHLLPLMDILLQVTNDDFLGFRDEVVFHGRELKRYTEDYITPKFGGMAKPNEVLRSHSKPSYADEFRRCLNQI